MVTFNLLPWRDQKAKYEKQQLVKLFAISITVTLFLLMMLCYYINYQKTVVIAQIDALNKEITWRNSVLINRFAFLKHSDLYNLFTKLKDGEFKTVCFNQVKKAKQTIELDGLTNSAEDLTDFLQKSNIASLFSELTVQKLEQKDDHLWLFHLIGKLNAV